MRILLAVSVVLALSACFGAPGEPLSTTQRANQDRATAKSFSFRQHTLTLDRTSVAPSDPREQALADIQATVAVASQQAYASAAAGGNHDVFAAQEAAVVLANAAATVQQRALEVQGDTQQDCGCEGCAPSDVDNAVVLSALAAEVGANIADDLSPPNDTQCSQQCGCEGCSDVCQEVPGTVDENQLQQDVGEQNTAGDNLGSVLG